MVDVFYFDKTTKKINLHELDKFKKKRLWIDITGSSKKEINVIKKALNLHPLAVEDLLNVHTRVKVEVFSHYLVLVFYGIHENNSVEMIEIDFIIGKNFVISSHKAKVESFEKLKKNKEKLNELFKKGADFLLHNLLDGQMDNYFPILEFLDNKIDAIEENITEHPNSANPKISTEILRLKKKLVSIKKIVLSQKEKIYLLTKGEYKFLSKDSLPYFRDIHDHSIKISDTIDSYRVAINSAFDIYMSTVSNSMNEAMKMLSMIATIALPLTVIAGIYGTNFRNLPGSTSFLGFWVMIFFMVLLCLIMMKYFRKKRWI